jgi:tRNA nucleotidyltransferase (CCA-adding enzyme)
MKNYLCALDKRMLTIARKIGKAADTQRLQAYLVGGVVRDLLLDREVFDMDVVISGDSAKFVKHLARQEKMRFVVYPSFYTASAFFPGQPRVDISAFRSEVYARPGALPRVHKGTFAEDLARRDFTINAMAISLNHDCFGTLVDPYHGFTDLQKKRIRVFHAKSFEDDPTRILRAVRFEQRLGFRIHRSTLRLLKEALRAAREKHVKPPRYFAEFQKILREPDPLKPLQRLRALGGLRFIAPGCDPNFRLLRKVHRRAANNTEIQREMPEADRWVLYFIPLIQGLQARAVRQLVIKFQIRKSDQKTILQLRRFSDIIEFLNNKELSPRDVYQRLAPLTFTSVLFLRVAASPRMAQRHIERYWKKYRKVTLRINGHDLKRMGLESGRAIGQILQEVFYQKLDQGLRTKKEELRAARVCLSGRKRK